MRTALGGRARRHARRMSPDERQRQARLKALAAKRRSGEPHLTFTTRAAGLALAFCAVLLTLAYPVKEFFGQRGQINSAKAQSVALEKHVASLTEQHQNAQTDTQIENDARLRLHYTYPGSAELHRRRPHTRRYGSHRCREGERQGSGRS